MSVALALLPVIRVQVMLAPTEMYRFTIATSARKRLKTMYMKQMIRSFVSSACLKNSERKFDMKKVIYRDLYNFEVLDKLNDGERVFVLDKALGEARLINAMTVTELMEILTSSRKEETRYIFWIIKEAEDEEDA